jgi:hypothetical protein
MEVPSRELAKNLQTLRKVCAEGLLLSFDNSKAKSSQAVLPFSSRLHPIPYNRMQATVADAIPVQ